MRLLLVEGDHRTAEDLQGELSRHGFEVDHIGTGADVLAGRLRADLVLLSLELPDLDGLEVCRRVRARSAIPIIAMTGRDTELDRVLGLEAGLDDYVIKPFRLQELVARIDAVMRRVRPHGAAAAATAGQDTITHGALLISLRSREVRLCDRLVHLTRKEFDLLALLASKPGTVFTRGQIMARVWHNEVSSSRTVDTHIGTLRAKLGARSWIVTVHGIGFRLGGA